MTLFVIYCVLMLLLLFIRPVYENGGTYWENVAAHFNPVPFSTIGRFIRALGYDLAEPVFYQIMVNLVGNVVLFIPLGAFMSWLMGRKRSFFKCLGIGAIIISVIEVAQMLTLLGYCDVDDLILNELGIAIGYLMINPIVKLPPQHGN